MIHCFLHMCNIMFFKYWFSVLFTSEVIVKHKHIRTLLQYEGVLNTEYILCSPITEDIGCVIHWFVSVLLRYMVGIESWLYQCREWPAAPAEQRVSGHNVTQGGRVCPISGIVLVSLCTNDSSILLGAYSPPAHEVYSSSAVTVQLSRWPAQWNKAAATGTHFGRGYVLACALPNLREVLGLEVDVTTLRMKQKIRVKVWIEK